MTKISKTRQNNTGKTKLASVTIKQEDIKFGRKKANYTVEEDWTIIQMKKKGSTLNDIA